VKRKAIIILLVLLVLLLGGGLYVSTYHLDEVRVEGCIMSSEEVIAAAVREDALSAISSCFI